MGKNTAEKLINSMYDLMASVGYEKASINKICKNVGVTKSSFYHFYESKEQLLLEIVKRSYVSGLDENIIDLKNISEIEEYKEYMKNLCVEVVESYLKDENLRKVCAEIDVQVERVSEVREFVEKSTDEIHLFLKSSLEHGVKIGAYPEGFDVELNTEILITTFIGLDTVLLHSMPINAIKVITKIVEGMFKE